MCRETWRTTPSALCALTQDLPALLIFRFLRGDLTYFRYSSQLALLSLSLCSGFLIYPPYPPYPPHNVLEWNIQPKRA